MELTKWAGVLGLVVAVLVGAAAVAADPPRPTGREHGVIAAALQAAIAETGLDSTALRSGLRAGSSLADLVTEAGGDVQAVIDAAVAAGHVQIDAALATGQLTEEQAVALADDLVEAVTSAINGDVGLCWFGPRVVRLVGARTLVGAVAEATGLSERAVAQEWRAGSTLSTVAEAHGASAEAIVAAAVARATERVNAQVEAGRMTQIQADLILGGLAERFLQAMNVTRGTGGVTL